MHEKDLNLHLYLPPHSCHPPGMLGGLIRGQIDRINALTTHSHDRIRLLNEFTAYLLARGHSVQSIRKGVILSLKCHPGFRDPKATSAHAALQLAQPTLSLPTCSKIFAHLKYHPSLVSASKFHRLFDQCVGNPPHKTPLKNLLNHKRVPFGEFRLIVAFHKPLSLSNLLAPRKLRSKASDCTAAEILNELRPDGLPPPTSRPFWSLLSWRSRPKYFS